MWARPVVLPAGCSSTFTSLATYCSCGPHQTHSALRPQQSARCLKGKQLSTQAEHSVHSPPAPAASASARSTSGARAAGAAAAAVTLLLAAPLLLAEPSLALHLHEEPGNALSLPTWAVHTSTLIEWVTAMGLVWQLGEVSGVTEWKGLVWAMLPNFLSATCAFTWHLFYNSPELEFLRGVQALLTIVGNFALWWAAYRLYRAMQRRQA